MTPTGSAFPEPGDFPPPRDIREPDFLPPRSFGPPTHFPPPGDGWPDGLEPEDVERPHVVVTLDTRTGAATFSGPYRTAIGALCAADVEYQVDRDQGGRGELTFHVATLQAPIGSDDGETQATEVAGAPALVAHRTRPLAQALSLMSTVADRTIRRWPRLPPGLVVAGTTALAAGDGSTRRSRAPRHRQLLGRVAR